MSRRYYTQCHNSYAEPFARNLSALFLSDFFFPSIYTYTHAGSYGKAASDRNQAYSLIMQRCSPASHHQTQMRHWFAVCSGCPVVINGVWEVLVFGRQDPVTGRQVKQQLKPQESGQTVLCHHNTWWRSVHCSQPRIHSVFSVEVTVSDHWKP